MIRARVEGKHAKDCSLGSPAALALNRRKHPWCSVLAEPPEVELTKSGRPSKRRFSGTWTWFRFRCSDPGCPAILLVRAEDVIDAAAKSLAEGGR